MLGERTVGWVTVCALAVFSLVGCGGDGSGDRVTAGQEAPAVDLPPNPLAERQGASTAWVGDSLFVYGGYGLDQASDEVPRFGDAFLLDGETGEASAVPPPPFGYPLLPRAVLAGVGGTVVLLGKLCAARLPEDVGDSGDCEPGDLVGAEFSIEDGTWQEILLPEGLAGAVNSTGRLLGVTGDGRVVLKVAGGSLSAEASPYWLYDPGSDEWAAVPLPGVRVDDECLAGDKLVVLTGSQDNAGVVVASPTDPSGSGVLIEPELRFLDLVSPDASWQATAPEASAVYTTEELACGGDFALVHNSDGLDVMVTDLTPGAEWASVPSTPARHVYIEAVWTGDRLVLVDPLYGLAVSYVPGSSTWEPLALPADTERVTWTGEELVALSENSDTGLSTVETSP